ncbi:MAG: ABC transporter permease, partial [Synergistaceae bacterium]|nr:ABC transporter permease [Synergistaceae bacterium]
MKLRTKAKIALRHLTSRPFQTFSVIAVTAFSAALAVALFVAVQGLRAGLVKAVEPFDLIAGAKGSPYQMVLNTVFLQDSPAGNISWGSYEELRRDSRVGLAVPLAFGDNYRGYPVVGTTRDILSVRPAASAPPWIELGEGRWAEETFEAVIGSKVSSESGLAIGDSFRTSHGITAGIEHDADFRVVGIARNAGGPYDRAVFVTLESIWEEHHHENEGEDEDGGEPHEGDEGEYGEITAVMVRPVSYTDAYSLAVSFQSDDEAQIVFPAQTVIRLFSMMGRGEAFLSAVVYAVVACALLSTVLVLYWAAAARRRERVLLRILGTPESTLIFISWLEGALLVFSGAVLGELLGRLGAAALFSAIGAASAIDPSAPLKM